MTFVRHLLVCLLSPIWNTILRSWDFDQHKGPNSKKLKSHFSTNKINFSKKKHGWLRMEKIATECNEIEKFGIHYLRNKNRDTNLK